MIRHLGVVIVMLVAASAPAIGRAEIAIAVAHRDAGAATAEFKFDDVPQPAQNDAASKAELIIVDGRRDANGGGLEKLNDGRLPAEADQPAENFFLAAGSSGGRLLVDLKRSAPIARVSAYSWHPGSRGPQVYQLYGSDGGEGFNPQPKEGTDPATCGWRHIADVDTRQAIEAAGGQYATSVSAPGGSLGAFRYLLFCASATERDDPFGHTFFSEIDVVEPETELVAAVPAGAAREVRREIVEAADGKYAITIDTTETPDLTEWAHEELAPVVRAWYPKIVELLPSDGFEAPAEATITFRANMRGVAATGGTQVNCAGQWFRGELDREAKGAIVHELVHVVQSYGRAGRRNSGATRTPGWVVEGIADYIRWYLYEPQSHGTDIAPQNASRARYDASYRTTANFLNRVIEQHGAEVLPALNAAAREGRYDQDLWKEVTGRPLEQLSDDWKVFLQKGDDAAADDQQADQSANALTDQEKADGWKLLFDGKSLDGWHSFHQKDVRPGWRVENGVLVCADPHDAGDLCTDDDYGAFELQLEYNISKGGNSGIMFHVTDEGGAAWATGPEFQLEDNAAAADPQRCGWLYALYQPADDPATGKPIDATKPAGEWNKVRLLISPEKCMHEINGVKYVEYVLGSEEFKKRVAASKFGAMPLFAKSETGYVALQGDHGQVSFRNIKIRPIPQSK
jgi:hypothetical protein